MAQKPQKKLELPSSIGPYAIIRSVGRGGMGEVFLAKDPACGRELALKRIRPDLSKNETIQGRFLREAKVASQLTHPSIIPILAIEMQPPDIYYTMPYVAGDTLRQVLRDTQHPITNSIPSLARIFLQICEAIAYTHAKGILHRDLKPENIIVGKYGEVMILDWGIADFLAELSEDDSITFKENADLTRPGKIAGTLAYMAPERLLGGASSVQADIYALGVMLYYMLTLQLPFQRKTLASFRKMAAKEELISPIEMAPYRDIPHHLAQVCRKCLAYLPEERFQSVEELIREIKDYSEGRAEWTKSASLHPNRATDWQFQENILLSKHIAISRELDETDWGAFMISQKSFASNVLLESKIRLGKESRGLGFLLSIPPIEDKRMLEEGYCLWLTHTEVRLYRNRVQVFSTPHGLNLKQICSVRFEKAQDVLRCALNGKPIFSYTSHLPLAGRHVGMLFKEGTFDVDAIEVFDASHNAFVRCLAVADAFLGHKLYDLALQEYRRIGNSFPGRQEGREALFRAGIALLEKGKSQRARPAKEQYCHLALKEFGNLYRTSGAPLEYLGKSLVYEALGDCEEEAKCLELAIRKFPKHPLSGILKEHIIARMHESSQNTRDEAYRIILLAIRHVPELLENSDTRALLASLSRNLEPLAFLESSDELSNIAIQLAFWLAKPLILGEMAASLTDKPLLLENALFCLLELEALSEFDKHRHLLDAMSKTYFEAALSGKLCKLPENGTRKEARLVCHLLRQALVKRRLATAEDIAKAALQRNWSKEDLLSIHSLVVWLFLLRKDLAKAEKVFDAYSTLQLTQELSPLYFPYGCYLYISESPEIAQAHFAAVLDTPYPPTTALPCHFLMGRINSKKGWIEKAFWWEKKELHHQLDFFYYSIGKKRK